MVPNKWSKPRNLGPNVNTRQADFAPFLAADDKTLYFASEGRGGYGKSDLFYCKRLDSTWTKWSAPRNLGPVVNSPDFDAYFTLSAADDDAYLVSSNNGTDGSKDIFRIGLAPAFQPEVVTLVTGKVLDAATGKPIRAIIHYENLLTGEEIGVTETNPADGSYTIVLPTGVQYGYRAEARNYIAENANLDVTERQKYSEQTQDPVPGALRGGPDGEAQQHLLPPEPVLPAHQPPTPSWPRLIKILRDYPTVEIKLSGHTDNQGDPALNLKLSPRPRERGAPLPHEQGHLRQPHHHRGLRRREARGQQRTGRKPAPKTAAWSSRLPRSNIARGLDP